MYAFAAQGRMCGIVGLKLKHQREILEKGFALSKKFKTANTYHFQPVPIPAEVKELEIFYFTKIRPQMSAKRASSSQDKDDPLFLDYNGGEFTNLGKYIALFLREVLFLFSLTSIILIVS